MFDLVGLAKDCSKAVKAVQSPLSCWDLGAHTHNNHCPANGYTALQGQSSGKCSFGIGKETPHKYLFVTVHQVPCTEATQRPSTHSGECSAAAVACSRPALPIVLALALPTMGGKQSGVEAKEQPPPEFSVPHMTPGKTRGLLI